MKASRIPPYGDDVGNQNECDGHNIVHTLFKNIRIDNNKVVYDSKIVMNDPLKTRHEWEKYNEQFIVLDYGGAIFSSFSTDFKPYYLFLNSDDYLEIITHGPYIESDFNGDFNIKTAYNSDNTSLINRVVPAFCKYPEMIDKHLLKQNCMEVKYADEIDNNKVVSASATTWEENDDGVWLPRDSYKWKSEFDDQSLPIKTFIPFDFSKDAENSDWVKVESNVKYNRYSNVLESSTPLDENRDIVKTTIFGHKSLFPIASITGAKYEECAVLTCDYDNNDESGKYFDGDNGWSKGIRSGGNCLLTQYYHFGTSAILVENCFGPTKNIKIDHTKDYMFSAWFSNEDPSKFALMAVEFHSDYPNGDETLIGAWNKPINDLSDDWEMQEHLIESSKLAEHITNQNFAPEDIKYYRIWIGNKPGNDPECRFKVDDIRFHPAKAMVKTFYYDKYWGKPIVAVGANNDPSKKISFDELGRVNKVFDNLNYNDNGLLKKYEYNVMGNDVLYPPTIKSPITKDLKTTSVDFLWFGPTPDENNFTYTLLIKNKVTNEETCYENILDFEKTVNLTYGQYEFYVYLDCKQCFEDNDDLIPGTCFT